MRQMSSAEFLKAMNSVTEPIEIRRYNSVVGVYYPVSFDNPVEGEPYPGTTLLGTDTQKYTRKRVTELEEEVSHLKRQLSQRSLKAPDSVIGVVDVGARDKDWLTSLGVQDRDFFERKLGSKKPGRKAGRRVDEE